MNRGGSSDSLYNAGDNIAGSSTGSSSPTDFSSDDENSADSLFLMSGQHSFKVRSKTRGSSGESVQANQDPIHKYLGSQRFRNSDQPLQPRHNILQPPAYPVMGTTDRCLPGHQFNPALHASTSLYNQHNIPTPENIVGTTVGSDQLESRLADVVSGTSSLSHLQDQLFNQRLPNQYENTNHLRLAQRDRLVNHRQAGNPSRSARTVLDDEENYSDLEAEQAEDILRPNRIIDRMTDYSSIQASMSNLTRNMNGIAVLMCAKLVECRTLREAIEIVELNRGLIEEVTQIVRDAPAYRNYDICNYQIDFSVKESFNPSFWIDREPVVTTADGNCQYHAVSLSLTGSEDYTSEVRLATAVAVIENQDWFDSMLKLIDRGSVIELVRTIVRNYSWGDETTLKAIAVAINRRIFLYTCNIGKKDFEMIKSLSRDELLDAFKEKKYRGGTGIHAYADPLVHVPSNNYIMLFHKSEHFIAVLPTTQQPTMFEPYNPIVPVFI